MFENRVVAQTVSELRGRYNPGSAPHVELTQEFDSNSVFAHEDAHRTISEGCTLGFYMVALAIAAERSTSEQTRRLASSALTDVCEQCWFVEEGFATRLQQLHIESTNGDLPAFDASLLPSYRSALGKFQISDRTQLEQLIRLSWPDENIDESQFKSNVILALETAAHVLAAASMSIPFASVLNNSLTLPNLQIMSHIRRNSPDLRLERLAVHMDARFAHKCWLEMGAAAISSRSNQLFKTADQCLDILIAGFASRGGVEVEPLWSGFQVSAMLEKLGVGKDSYKFHDIQGLSLDDAKSHFATVSFDAAEDLVKNPPMPLEDAQRGYAEIVVPQVAGQAYVFCELGPHSEIQSPVTVFLHVFTCDGVNPRGQAVRPRLAALIHTQSNLDDVPLLRERFPSHTWNWLIGDFDLDKWDTSVLGRSGKTFAVRMHLRGSPARPHAKEFLIPADPVAVVSTTSAEPSIALAVLQPLPQDGDCVLVDLASSKWASSEAASPLTMEMICLGNTLKFGYLRGIVSLLMKGGHNAE